MNINELQVFTKNTFGDLRLANRGNFIIHSLILSGTSVVNRAFKGLKERTAAYRFLQNPQITSSKIRRSLRKECLENVKNMENQEHILVIQDTTEFNFKDHTERITKKVKNPRQVTNDHPGYFCHTSIAMGTETNKIYGIPYVDIYNWGPNRKRSSKDPKRKQRPITECQSFRWIKTAQKCSNLLSSSVSVTILSDREGDIYEHLSDNLKPNVNILVRSSQNRKLCNSEFLLKEHMEQCKTMNTYEFTLPSRGHGHKARNVKMMLKYDEVEISRPANYPDAENRNIPKTVLINCVLAKECGTPPAGEDPVEWRLLTTHKIADFESARKCVEWYRKRWFIEEVFRVMKNKGLQIEDAQLEDLKSLAKLTLLSLVAAARIVSLKTAFDLKEEKTSALQDFSEEEMDVMKKRILPKIEGKTKIQKNPYQENTLAWAGWIIARMGGWSGYLSQSKPGYVTFKRGLDKFYVVMSFISDI